MYDYNLIFLLLQQMCVYLVIAWVLSKTPLVLPVLQVTVRLPHKLMCYLIFSVFCVMGTYFGLNINDSIANTRAIGSVLGGLLGGPSVGLLVGFTGGLHRYSLGGDDGVQLYGVHYCRGAYRRPGSPLLYEARADQQTV
ncbi:Probable sensor-like histidine kinase YehU [Morganella morganii]|nr:Probable sensor-like histidine kinase YehU [Morganella morganii]